MKADHERLKREKNKKWRLQKMGERNRMRGRIPPSSHRKATGPQREKKRRKPERRHTQTSWSRFASRKKKIRKKKRSR